MNHFLQDPRRTGINTLGAGGGRCRRTIAVLATLSVVAGAVGMLDAGPSGASVIAVGGAVAFISPPPLISPTSIPSNGSVVAFTERTAYTLPRSLPVTSPLLLSDDLQRARPSHSQHSGGKYSS